MAFFIVSGIRTDIDFSAKEVAGVRYLRPLGELLVRVPAYMRATDAAAADAEAARADAAFAELDRQQAALGAELAVAPAALEQRKRSASLPSSLEAAWKNLKSVPAAGRAREGASLVLALRDLVVHVGDSSNLILDPDLDTYYLMDVVLLALPDSLARLNAEAERTGEDPVERAVFLKLRSDVDAARVETSSRTALAEDPNFLGANEKLQQSLPPALDRYLALGSAAGDRLSGSARQAAASAAALAAGDYWKTAAEDLEVLLQVRVDHHRSRLATAISSAAIAVVFAYLMVFVISRNLLAQIGGLRRRVSAMAAKDLRCVSETASSDELGDTARDLVVLTEALSSSIASFRSSAQEMERSAAEVSSSSGLMSRSSGEIASTVEEIAATVEQSSESMASIRKNVESQFNAIERTTASLGESGADLRGVVATMDELERLAEAGGASADTGSRSVGGLIEKSKELGARSRSLASRVEGIRAATASIGETIDLIGDIAQRTQILAMNASIEAARAGSAGKGFAVVAGSVRELASSTAAALDGIRERTKAIDDSVSEAAKDAREAERLCDLVSTQSSAAEAALKGIGGSTGQLIRGIKNAETSVQGYEATAGAALADSASLRDLSLGIKNAVREQEAGSTEVMKSVHQLRDTAARNAAASESLAELSESLRKAGKRLEAVIADFALEGDGGPNCN